ncbi:MULTISPECIES: RNHCP domain-containing protein [unclassified Parafrankia]|uniref:RNHCP domain-containing protein n=1 Tax=Parafrankia TaxID=2994362 RepID=UPI0000541073|nr:MULTISPECIES: RNHCP domain-containing protein [unclassified Parafrankia]ABW09649.1 hypothetical protein Franean1_0182 [Frankia sp. EAN1pec]TCJ33634.1 RNHCP domain-containing protein [Parafrankia sp. BMG5.11]SQD93648.1 conserved hypothetical protein [Parafrankia sp. Ea1.12]
MQPPEDGPGAARGADDGRRFARTPEDFACLVCGATVRGDGYTNHCPACLWSRHVDVNPGDRAAPCRGLMRPVGVEMRARETVLTHRCESCGHLRRNRTSPADAESALFALAARVADEVSLRGPGDAGLRGGAAVRGTGRGSGAPRRRGRPR